MHHTVSSYSWSPRTLNSATAAEVSSSTFALLSSVAAALGSLAAAVRVLVGAV